MKNHKTTAFTVLSEELNSKTLMNLVGGTNANPIRTTNPHDLITPSSGSEPYTDDDVEEEK